MSAPTNRMPAAVAAPGRALEVDLRTFLDFAPNPVLVVDAAGTVVYANEAVRGLLGYAPDELLGQAVEVLVPAGVRPGHAAMREGYMADPRPRPMGSGRDLTAVTREGRAVPVEISLGPLATPEGPLVGVMLADLRARRRAEDEARAYLTELERSNRELQDFAYVASHDLQAPLRKIRSFGGRLVDRCRDQLGAKGADYLDRMVRAAERMQVLIDDLLSFSRVTTMATPAASVDLAEVARGVLSDLSEVLREQGAEVEVGPLPRVHADRTQMRQLLQNLLANGVRYHRPDQRPKVRVRVETGEGGPLPPRPGFCRLVVEDEGIGFDPRHAERMFQIFQRLHDGDGYQGSGIGLAICKKIVERHGGRIMAEGRPGEGATFTAELPLEPGD